MAESGIGVNRRTLSVARNYHCKTRYVSGCGSDRGIVCAYDADVPASREIKVDMPRHYGKKVQAGLWSVKVVPHRA